MMADYVAPTLLSWRNTHAKQVLEADISNTPLLGHFLAHFFNTFPQYMLK